MEEEQHGNLIKKCVLPQLLAFLQLALQYFRHGALNFRESISYMYAVEVHMGVVYQGLENCAFLSQDLERCYIQTLCHTVECHPPHRDQHTVILDASVLCKESLRGLCPSGCVCTEGDGRPVEWTVLHQYFPQRTNSLNKQQISTKLSHWI